MSRQARVLVAALLVLLSAGVAVYSYGRLPERVPIHFNGAGDPDGWGPKKFAVIMPVGLMLFMCGIWAVSARAIMTREYWERKIRKPVSEAALEKMAAGSLKVIDLVMVITMAMFLVIQAQTLMVGTGRMKGLAGIWIFIAALAAVAVFGSVKGLLDRRRAEEESSPAGLTRNGF